MNRPILYEKCLSSEESRLTALNAVLQWIQVPFKKNDSIGIKLHWGEIGNKNFLPPIYAREIVRWLKENDFDPFVFDNTVIYSGGRRDGKQSLKTAETHNYSPDYLGCPVKIGDGLDGKSVVDLPTGFKNFEKVQVGKIVEEADGFIIFSHFKGHMETGFGGAIKNISMGFASRAQKQRMHADAKPSLIEKKCIQCGECAEVCPTGAATMEENEYPSYDLDKCIGCAQCIAMCPETALKIIWETDIKIFQEKLVETAAAVWRIIQNKTVIINALLNIVAECDCLPGNHRAISEDKGFIGAYHPVTADSESIKLVGADCIDQAHRNIPWGRQFEYARQIGFGG
jgi:uncharacterized Fe-S center protein